MDQNVGQLGRLATLVVTPFKGAQCGGKSSDWFQYTFGFILQNILQYTRVKTVYTVIHMNASVNNIL